MFLKGYHPMLMSPRPQLYRISASLLLLLVVVGSVSPVLVLAQSALAQQYIPPDRGLPGRREGGGTRGNCPRPATPLVALSPDTNFGTTTEPYPTFYWYLPELSNQFVEFVLLDENDNEVYRTAFQHKSASGIISVTVPTTTRISPLEIGKDYHWFFSLVCDRRDRSGDIYVEGWIQRVTPSSDLARRVVTASAEEKAVLYARAGIWYDAVKSLAELRRTRPTDTAILNQWTALLRSVGLDNIANQPFLECCQMVSDE